MNFSNVLTDIRDKLAKLPNIKTCRIGIESTLTPESYPLIRIQMLGFKKSESQTHRNGDLMIYFGLPLVEGDVPLESIYAQMLELEQKIVNELEFGAGYRSTYERTLVSDSSVSGHYLLFGVQLSVSYMQD